MYCYHYYLWIQEINNQSNLVGVSRYHQQQKCSKIPKQNEFFLDLWKNIVSINFLIRPNVEGQLPPSPLPPGPGPGPLPLPLPSGPDFFVDKWSLTCVLFFDFHAKILAKYPLASTCLQLQKLEKDPRKREYFSTSQRLHNEVDSFLKYSIFFNFHILVSTFHEYSSNYLDNYKLNKNLAIEN